MKMQTCVALFRGINVVGKNLLPMKELASLMTGLGCGNVRTYIQSGNAVFDCRETDIPRVGAKIASAVRKRHGFEPVVLVLGPQDLEIVVAGNPFPDAVSDPQRLHVGFLAAVPEKADMTALGLLAAANERFRVVGRAFYLHAPDGIGRSKLAAGAERKIGVPMTIRNWRTVSTLLDMVGSAQASRAPEQSIRRERPIP